MLWPSSSSLMNLFLNLSINRFFVFHLHYVVDRSLIWDSDDSVREIAHPSAVRGTTGSAGVNRSWSFDAKDLPPLLAVQEQIKRY